MRIVVTGATGLIGTALCHRLHQQDMRLTVLVRDEDKAREHLPDVQPVVWKATSGPVPADVLSGADAVINLAGESIAERWTEEKKRKIRESRVIGTRNLVAGMLEAEPGPSLLISASAVGYYGRRGDEKLDEESKSGEDFLAEVCREWEAEALRAREGDARVVLLRTGVVLSERGGALQEIMRPFKLFAGGPLGDGRQYMSWIHMQDHLKLIEFALASQAVEGPVNSTAPNPVTNREFARKLGNVLNRPAFIPTPGIALKILFGEMAEALLLEGQRVLPRKALTYGFGFDYPKLEDALRDLLNRN